MPGSDRIYRQIAAALLLSAIIFSFLNLLLVLNVGKNHEMEMFRYTIYITMAIFPLIITWSTVSSYLGGKKKHRSVETVKMHRGEHLLLNTTPHPLYFVKLAVSIGMLAALLLYLSMFGAYEEPISDAMWWWKVLAISGISAAFIYSMSADLLPHHSYLESVESAWALFFAFWWSLTATAVLKAHIELYYPKAYWEEFFGLPSMAMMMFAVILFLMSSMVWRVDRYLSGKKSTTPLGTISITLMAAGIAALFPPLWFLFSEGVREMFFYATMMLSLVLWAFLMAFLYYRGGMRFIFTTKRIITVKKFTGVDIDEHPYDSIISVELMQGIFGRHFNYGDLRFRVRRGKKVVKFTVHGVSNPALAKNTVTTLSRVKKKEKRSKHTRKKKKKKEKTYHFRPY